MSAAGGPDLVTNGLVLHLDAASRRSYNGGTIWRDLAENNNFTLNNSPTFTAENGGAIIFDGVNDFISGNLNLSLFNQITIEVWVREVGLGGIVYEHSTNWNNNIGGFGFGINSDGQGVDVTEQHSVHNTAGSAAVGARNILYTAGMTNYNCFTNIFSRVSDTTGRLWFVNGVLRPFFQGPPLNFSTSTSTSNTFSFLNTTLFIGSRAGTTNFFTGRISVFRVYNRKLSATEVLQNYNATRSRFGV